MIDHRGYVAHVEFEDSADVFHGRVVNTGAYPILTFESEKASRLRAECKRMVDPTCVRGGGHRAPQPSSGTLNVRLGSKLHARVVMAAAKDGISIKSWIVKTLDAGCRP